MTIVTRPHFPRHRWVRWLADEPHNQTGLRILQIAIGLSFVFKVVTQWPYAEYLWGPTGIAAGNSISGIPPLLGSHLGGLVERAFATPFGTHVILALLSLAGIGLILGRMTLASTFAALVCSSALDARLPLLPDGGDNVTALVLVYLLFALPPRMRGTPSGSRVWLHNVAVLAIIMQTAILYFISGLSKAGGEMWQHGIALYYISQVSIFSSQSMRWLFGYASIVTLATYAVMFWELMFPMAIISHFRVAWIVVGIAFEIGVAHFMGLSTFSTVMIGLLLFIPSDGEYRRYFQKLWMATTGSTVLSLAHKLNSGDHVA